MIDRQPILLFIEDRRADVQRLLDEASTARLWWPYEVRAKKAAECFYQACEVLSTHPPGNSENRPENLACALRVLPGVRRSVFQYQADYGSFLNSARRFWREADGLQDYELLALFALNESHVALNDFFRMLAQFDRSADDEGIGRRDDLREAAHRKNMAVWEIEESAYAGRNLDRAREILAEANIAAARFEPRPATQIIREVASMNGRKGGKTKPTDPVKNFALERYKEKKWPSARKASFELRDEVFNFSKSAGIRVSDDNLQTTMHKWFLRYDKDTQSGN